MFLLLLVFSFYKIDLYIQSQLVGNLDDHVDRRIIIRLFEAADIWPGHTKSIGDRLLRNAEILSVCYKTLDHGATNIFLALLQRDMDRFFIITHLCHTFLR